MTELLTAASLAKLNVAKHEYARHEVLPGILHLGIGGFHRAHQAAYTEAVLADGDLRWGILGASLRSTSMRNRLAPQDFLYTLAIKGQADTSYQVIGAIKSIYALSAQRDQIIDATAAPETKIITLTITEKGYCLDSKGELDLEHPDIHHDLANPNEPISMPGLLALGLRQRLAAGTGPLSILSCDNLASNGEASRRAVMTMVEAQSAKQPASSGYLSSAWINDKVSFPNSMVDRIVPQTQPGDISDFERVTGFTDKGLVTCEPYSQWVIEDQFAAERPAWEIAGAQLVNDVAGWELVKLRTLNATHTALACLGILCGYEYIHETLQDPDFASFASYLMEHEIAPVTPCPPDLDLADYRRSVLERFSNSAIRYPVTQVASDTSQKLPQRIYPTLMAHIQAGTLANASGLILVVAAWLHCHANHAKGISDKPATELLAAANGVPAGAARSGSHLLGEPGQHPAFINQLASCCHQLAQTEPRALLRQM